MKRFFYFSTIFLVLAGCSKDEEKSFAEKLEGEWYSTLIQFANCDDPSDDYELALVANCDGSSCLRITFEKDGNGEAYFKLFGTANGPDSLTWAGDEDAFTLCTDGDCLTGTADFDGSNKFTMVLFDDGDGCSKTYVMQK